MDYTDLLNNKIPCNSATYTIETWTLLLKYYSKWKYRYNKYKLSNNWSHTPLNDSRIKLIVGAEMNNYNNYNYKNSTANEDECASTNHSLTTHSDSDSDDISNATTSSAEEVRTAMFNTADNPTLKNIISDSFKSPPKYKKLSMHAIKKKVLDDYVNENESLSAAFDILACYLKGQKLIYLESKAWCESLLNKLMLPAIFLSTVSAVLTEILDNYNNGKVILASISCLITFLLSVVQYLKLDASAEAHKTSAHQYDRLQSSVEFCSGALLLFKRIPTKNHSTINHVDIMDAGTMNAGIMNTGPMNTNTTNTEITDELEQKLSYVESKIREIKSTNQFVVPKTVRNRYPVIANTNIFVFIKKINDRHLSVITQLKNVKNEIKYFNYIQVEQHKKNLVMSSEYKYHNLKLFETKKLLINELLLLKSAFSTIDQMFQQEILNANVIRNTCWGWNCCFKPTLVDYNTYNKRLSCFERAYSCICCNINLIDPTKLNTFIENLLDPYNNSHINDKNIITHLETLWFNSQEDDWLLKRQSDIEQVANRV